jgi:hypothetical protein
MEPKATTRAGDSFAALARDALARHLPATGVRGLAWGARAGLVWVRWQRGDDMNVYLGLRRHLEWVTGEAGISVERHELDALPARTGEGMDAAVVRARGYRVRLGELLHEEDRWWPSGATPDERARQLDWIVLQLRLKADGYFLRHPPALDFTDPR